MIQGAGDLGDDLGDVGDDGDEFGAPIIPPILHQLNDHCARQPELNRMDRKADVLAFDGNGKQYLTAKVSGSCDLMVVVADSAAGSVEPLASVQTFAAVLKADNMPEYFGGDIYDQWRVAVGKPDAGLAFTECVEYTMPLWLGGQDDITNLTLIDMDVSWTVCAQARQQAQAAGALA